MHLIHAQYKILDVFEKNPFQSLMLGSSLENPEDIAVVNEVLWSPLFTRELAQSLLSGFINLKTHSEDETSCQLVTAYHQGIPINKYLSSRSLPFSNRINLCYEFLKAMVSYEAFPSWIQDILIDEDQIIVWEDQLRYNELLILKTNHVEDIQNISFSKVQKKIHRIIEKLIGSSSQASPALMSFMARLGSTTEGFESLKAVYDDFQNVYLYDYYLNQDDTAQPTVDLIPIPVIIPEESEALSEDIIPAPEPPEPGPLEQDTEGSSDTPMELNSITPLPVLPTEIAEGAVLESEADPVDADMEKNLELFFNRDRQQSETAVDSENASEKRKTLLWIALGVAGIVLLVWAAVHAFMPGTKPVAAFSSTEKNGVWMLKNESTFTDQSAVKRCEWTVYQNGKLIDLYDTYDLTLALEEEGAYQVVLRVMDLDGTWSSLYQDTLENHLSGTAIDTPEISGSAATATGTEKMDQFSLKFSQDRTHKDTAFFRTGSYSLQIMPGKRSEILDVQGVLLDKNGMVSVWIASDTTEAVTVVFTGYNQNAKMFTKEVTHQPLAPRQWEMRQFTVESEKLVNRMTIAFKTDSLINLDDLSIESYK